MTIEAAGQGSSVVAVGTTVAGRYVVERVLGQGGMGVVVAARHLQLQNRVAIKFLLPESSGSPEVVARFLREAQALTKLQSEHVARVIDVGTLETGAPYMIMEYLDGRDVAALLHERKTLPFDQAAEIVLQAIDALAEAHAQQIVHRDLKPANLFCAERADGTTSIKLLDFGISKTVTSDKGLTSTRAIMGSPLYMSPEQLRSAKSVDTRSDIWSLGVILYELLTGRVPFDGESIGEVFAAILESRIVPPRELRPDVPIPLERAVMGCLERDPARRIPTVAVLAELLAPFATPKSHFIVERVARIMARTSGGPSTSASTATGHTFAGTGAAWGSTAVGAKRSRSLVPIVATLGTLSALVVAVLVWRGTRSHAPPVIAAEPPSVAAASAAATPVPSAPAEAPSVVPIAAANVPSASASATARPSPPAVGITSPSVPSIPRGVHTDHPVAGDATKGKTKGKTPQGPNVGLDSRD